MRLEGSLWAFASAGCRGLQRAALGALRLEPAVLPGCTMAPSEEFERGMFKSFQRVRMRVASKNKTLMLLGLIILLSLVAVFVLLNNQERRVVYRVIDGDTIIDDAGNTYRLVGINTPEKHELCSAEAKGYLESLIFAKEVVIVNLGKDKYGRGLAEVYYDGGNVNKKMLEGGFANAYYSENQNIDWKGYVEAEKRGRENGGCFWKKSTNGLCIEGEKTAEGFELYNTCNFTIKTTVVIRDTSTAHRIKKNVEIDPKERIIISEECGEDTKEVLYLCQHIFNDYGDELLIFDQEGLFAYVPYGVYNLK